MGTNYYWRDSPCGHCNRFEEIHVGKRSAGWSFGFRGYRSESPVGFAVASRSHWRQVFANRPGVLVNEYGEQEQEPVIWLANLEPPSSAQRVWEESYDARGPWSHPDEREWRDTEGFRFYDGDFQ
jgi:hypothetical protein